MSASWFDIKETDKTFREYMKRFLEGKQGDDLKQQVKRAKFHRFGAESTM